MPLKTARIGIVMDPIHAIKPYKDSTLAMMLAAKSLGASLYYMEPDDLFIQDGQSHAYAAKVDVFDDLKRWHAVEDRRAMPLKDLDIILMRKDPPVDKRFIHCCYLLEQAAREGVRVVNNPTALVALNEKLFATHFPDLCPPTLIASDKQALRDFLDRHGTIIIKPLDSMGGEGVFQVKQDDVNFEVIWELETKRGTYPVVAQRFIPEILDGDKRVLVINGQPFHHVLVRTPKQGSIRGNMAAGGTTQVRAINEREQAIAKRVGMTLVEKGITLCGLDIIGDRLIEINITSPTGLREISKGCGEDVAMVVMKGLLAA
jgi:glutathione synthase